MKRLHSNWSRHYKEVGDHAEVQLASGMTPCDHLGLAPEPQRVCLFLELCGFSGCGVRQGPCNAWEFLRCELSGRRSPVLTGLRLECRDVGSDTTCPVREAVGQCTGVLGTWVGKPGLCGGLLPDKRPSISAALRVTSVRPTGGGRDGAKGAKGACGARLEILSDFTTLPRTSVRWCLALAGLSIWGRAKDVLQTMVLPDSTCTKYFSISISSPLFSCKGPLTKTTRKNP